MTQREITFSVEEMMVIAKGELQGVREAIRRGNLRNSTRAAEKFGLIADLLDKKGYLPSNDAGDGSGVRLFKSLDQKSEVNS